MALSEAEELELLELEEQEAKEAQAPSKTESFLRGAAQGATFGFQDELSPLVEKGIAKGAQVLSNIPGLQGLAPQAQETLATPNEELAKEYRAESQAAEAANPKSAFAGQIAGGLVGTAPAFAMAAPVTVPGAIAAGAGLGAVQGALSGAGSAEPGQRLSGAASGALVGAGVGGALGAAPAIGSAVLNKVKGFRDFLTKETSETARKALFSSPAMIKKVLGKGVRGIEKATEAAKILKENGLFRRGAAPEALFESAQEIAEAAGRKLDEIYPALDASGQNAFDLPALIGRVKEATKEYAGKKSFQNVNNKIADMMEDLVKMSPEEGISFSKAREMKQFIGELAFGDNVSLESKEPLKKIWRTLTDLIDEGTDSVKGPLGDQLRQANKLSSSASKAIDVLDDRLAKELGRGKISLSPVRYAEGKLEEKLPGAVMGAQQKAAGALDSLLKASKKMGKFASPIIQAAKRGGPQAASAHYVLMQSNPQYREAYKKATEGESNE